MIKAKTFIEALNCFSTDTRRSRRFLNDKRLSQSEKNILNCFFLLRENQHQEIISELSKITEIADPVVLAQKNLLLGITYNNLDQHQKALTHLQSSRELLKNNKLSYFEMIAELNLFVVYQNLKDGKSMRKVLWHLKKLPVKDPLSKIRILRCHFKYAMLVHKLDDAESALEEIHSLKKHLSDSDAIGLLVDQFNFAITKNDLPEARHHLNQMKTYRAFASTEQYNFMKKLLDFLLEKKTIYIQDQDFFNSPVLFYQIKVINFLASAKDRDAEKMWKQLRMMNVNLYGEDFKYHGPVCLFSLALDKVLTHLTPVADIIDPIQFILNHPGPIRKDDLFRAFWGTDPESKEDYAKLSKRLYDLKQKHGFTLKTEKGCYILVRDSKKAA